jgi:hypothetical protein
MFEKNQSGVLSASSGYISACIFPTTSAWIAKLALSTTSFAIQGLPSGKQFHDLIVTIQHFPWLPDLTITASR